MRKLCLLLITHCFIVLCTAQTENASRPVMKFGDVKVEDFAPTVYAIDSHAQAIVLFDYGKAYYEVDSKGGFNVVYRFHRRVRILNKNAFSLATVEIPMFKGSTFEDRLDKLEAATYTVEGGKVQATKVDKSSIFKDKVAKEYYVQKFTFPNLSEGCIIEYNYTILSPFEQRIHSWNFQDMHPVLWSEYDVSIPELYNFVTIKQWNEGQLVVNKSSVTPGSFNILIPGQAAYERSEVVTYKGNVYQNIWAMKDLPALKLEPFTTTLKNHIAKIDFQLVTINLPGRPPIHRLRGWTQASEDLMKNENFGKCLTENNGWLSDDLKKIIGDAATDLQVAKNVYEYVRNNFTCTDKTEKYVWTAVKKVYQAKKGSVAEINMLLAAMLQKIGFKTDVLLLSTRSNGKSYDAYPLMDRLNYLVVRVKINDEFIYLDASDPKIGFGKLPAYCYNGFARVIDPVLPALVPLSPDSLKENKLTSVFIINEENGKMSGSYTSQLGYYESYNTRNKIAKETKEEFFKEIKKEYTMEVDIENTVLEGLDDFDNTVSIKYDFKLDPSEELIYFNPMLAEATKDNPFKSVKRHYPVEMSYTFNETYVLNMEVPAGYKVDEMPKSARIKLNEDEGMFEYIIANDGKRIQLRSKIALYKATFTSEDYDTLREFFAYIVKKHNEQIVLKKI